MTDDIVERLRGHTVWKWSEWNPVTDGPEPPSTIGAFVPDPLSSEAAEEILALRAENELLNKSIDENIAWDGKQALAEHALFVKVRELAILLESRMGQVAT